MKYKVGDICEILQNKVALCGNGRDLNAKFVRIIDVGSSWYRYQLLDESKTVVGDCSGCYNDSHLKLAEEPEIIKPKKTIMSKLSNTFKLLTDLATQSLRKAGYINGDLELTPDGQDALNSILLSTNKEALVKLAEEKIAEEKEATK